MHDGEARQRVGLHESEGRAWHIEPLVAGEMADQCARKCGLAGPEIARERDEVAGFQN